MTARVWKTVPPSAFLTRVIASVAALLVSYAALRSLGGLIKSLTAVGGESIEPSQKARILAEGISEAMNCTAFALVVGVPGVIVIWLLTRKHGADSR